MHLGDDTISRFRIDPDGTLVEPPTTTAAGLQPSAVAVDPAGRFLYVANTDLSDNTISAFQINPDDGTLQPIGALPTGGNGQISVTTIGTLATGGSGPRSTP